jgi:hypothetical protein
MFKVVRVIDVPERVKLFNLCFVDEVKNAGTSKVFEKLCLVVQAYNDYKKEIVLT